MNYDWNALKTGETLKTHGVRFDEAKTVGWILLLSSILIDDHSESEERFIRIGTSAGRTSLNFVDFY